MLITPRYDGPTIITIDGSAHDVSVPVAQQRRRMEAMLGRLGDSQWNAPSRCEGWTVQDVVAHLVGVNGFWQLSIAAGLSGEPTRVLGSFDPAATPRTMVAAMRSLTPAETFAQFSSSNDGVLDALAALGETGWESIAESPPGHVPIRLLAHHALWDAWVHERDIALSLGLPTPSEPDEVAACLRYAAAVSPALAVTRTGLEPATLAVVATSPSIEFTMRIGDSVDVRAGAELDVPTLRGDATMLVEALSLRVDLPPDMPGEWRVALAGLAAAFDQSAL